MVIEIPSLGDLLIIQTMHKDDEGEEEVDDSRYTNGLRRLVRFHSFDKHRASSRSTVFCTCDPSRDDVRFEALRLSRKRFATQRKTGRVLGKLKTRNRCSTKDSASRQNSSHFSLVLARGRRNSTEPTIWFPLIEGLSVKPLHYLSSSRPWRVTSNSYGHIK